MKTDEKKCPQCAENIKAEAKVCRHCGHTFSDEDVVRAKNAVTGKKAAGCLVPLGLILLLGYCVSQAGRNTGPVATIPTVNGQTGNAPATAGDHTPVPSNWDYSDSKDEMRGSNTHFAIATSTNEVEMPFPYNGGVRGQIQIRRRKSDGLQVLFHVDKGQILCNDYNGTRLHIKIDSGSVRGIGCTEPNDGDSSYAFIDAPASFLARLKKSKTVMIEADMFDSGSRQWTFNTAGLVWR